MTPEFSSCRSLWKAFLLKENISNRKHFVYNQDIGIRRDRGSKGKAENHPVTVCLNWAIEIVTNLRKL